jgi:hypothetical protein
LRDIEKVKDMSCFSLVKPSRVGKDSGTGAQDLSALVRPSREHSQEFKDKKRWRSGIRHTIFVFKEQFLKSMGLLASIFTPARDEPRYELKIAALLLTKASRSLIQANFEERTIV